MANNEKLAEEVAKLQTQIAVLDGTIKTYGKFVLLLIPITLGWLYYLGNVSDKALRATETQAVTLRYYEELLRDHGKAITELKYDARDVRDTKQSGNP